MEPKFIELPEIKVVGLGAKFISIRSPDKNNSQVIPALWHSLAQQMEKIPHRAGEDSYGLVESLPKEPPKSHADELFYIAGVPVLDFEGAPAEMLRRTIPAGKYACFTHKGKLDRLEQTMNFIYGVWVPGAKIALRRSPHLELYDQRFVFNSDQSEFDILLPIQ